MPVGKILIRKSAKSAIGQKLESDESRWSLFQLIEYFLLVQKFILLVETGRNGRMLSNSVFSPDIKKCISHRAWLIFLENINYGFIFMFHQVEKTIER